jgi:ABC-type multidrug transport system ATPase subunit
MPEKYETRLGERGALLSGGERQRISIARAFLKDAPICILDEPTSSIDSRTESVILDSLERLMLGRTTFMIAHRLSTVRDADLILVLNHGELVEQGTHDDLLGQESLYGQLHIAQTGQAQHKESVERFEKLEIAVQETSTSTRQSNGRAQLGGTWETPPTAREAGVPDSTANDTVQPTPPDPPARASESPKVAHWRDGETRTEELQGEPETTHPWRRYLLYAIFAVIVVAVIVASVYLGRNLIF